MNITSPKPKESMFFQKKKKCLFFRMKLSSPKQEKQKKEKQKHPKTISSILAKTNFVLYFGMPADKSIKKKF